MSHNGTKIFEDNSEEEGGNQVVTNSKVVAYQTFSSQASSYLQLNYRYSGPRSYLNDWR